MPESLVSFLMKLQASACNFFKMRLWHWYFPVNFAKFLRKPFLQNTFGRLLLSGGRNTWNQFLIILIDWTSDWYFCNCKKKLQWKYIYFISKNQFLFLCKEFLVSCNALENEKMVSWKTNNSLATQWLMHKNTTCHSLVFFKLHYFYNAHISYKEVNACIDTSACLWCSW